jgi:hypothetical protein
MTNAASRESISKKQEFVWATYFLTVITTFVEGYGATRIPLARRERRNAAADTGGGQRSLVRVRPDVRNSNQRMIE